MENRTEDMQLIANIKERIRWYQEEAAPEQIDRKEMEALYQLLDRLEPEEQDDSFDPEKAYERFANKYLHDNGVSRKCSVAKKINQDGIKKKQAKKKISHPASRVWKYIGITAASIVLLFTVLNIGTYATAKKGFFEFITQNETGRSFFINGGESGEDMGMISNGEIQYASWEELPEEVLERICVPTYIPEGMVLQKLSYCVEDYTDMIRAIYSDGSVENKRIKIWGEEYEDTYTWKQEINDEAKGYEQKELGGHESIWYQYDDEYRVYFFEKNELYTVFGECSIEELEKIVENMQCISQKSKNIAYTDENERK